MDKEDITVYVAIFFVTQGRSELTSSKAWTIPSPSQTPMEPPTSERKLARLNSGKSVLVTSTLLEKERRIVE